MAGRPRTGDEIPFNPLLATLARTSDVAGLLAVMVGNLKPPGPSVFSQIRLLISGYYGTVGVRVLIWWEVRVRGSGK